MYEYSWFLVTSHLSAVWVSPCAHPQGLLPDLSDPGDFTLPAAIELQLVEEGATLGGVLGATWVGEDRFDWVNPPALCCGFLMGRGENPSSWGRESRTSWDVVVYASCIYP